MIEALTALFEPAPERPHRAGGVIEQQEIAADLEQRIALARVERLELGAVPEQEPERAPPGRLLAEARVEVRFQ